MTVTIVLRASSLLLNVLLLFMILFGCQRAEITTINNSSADLEFSELFDKEQLLCVNLIMDPQLFELMSKENHFSPEQLNQAEVWDIVFEYFDGTQEIPNYYNWYNTDICINDINLKQAGIRNKGFLGSGAWPSPAFKIRTDRSIEEQSIAYQKYLTFNNASSDWTRFRSCLTLELFAKAGYPAPICNLAKVDLNGSPLGFYVNIEPIKESFLLRNFGCSTGSLYEGLSPLDLDYLPRFEAKTDYSDPDKAMLNSLIEALNSPDEKLIENLSEYLNIDLFIRFWALELICGHIDGYSANQNNYYIYFNPADQNRAVFIPWGIDMTFMSHEQNPIFNSYHYLMSKIPKRLAEIPYMKERMEDEVAWVLNEVWDSKEMLKSIDRYEEIILKDFDYYAQPIDTAEYKALVKDLRVYVEMQPANVLANMKSMFRYAKETDIKHIETYDQRESNLLIGKIRWEKLTDGDPSIGIGFVDKLFARVRYDILSQSDKAQATSVDWFIAKVLVSDALPYIVIIGMSVFLIVLTSVLRRVLR